MVAWTLGKFGYFIENIADAVRVDVEIVVEFLDDFGGDILGLQVSLV